jgi:hypothetical protein
VPWSAFSEDKPDPTWPSPAPVGAVNGGAGATGGSGGTSARAAASARAGGAPWSAFSKDRQILPEGYTFGWKSTLSPGALPNLHSGGLVGYSSVKVLHSRERTAYERLSGPVLTPGEVHTCGLRSLSGPWQ